MKSLLCLQATRAARSFSARCGACGTLIVERIKIIRGVVTRAAVLSARCTVPILSADRGMTASGSPSAPPVKPFDVAVFNSLLSTRKIGRRIDCHTSTPSTMNLADERLRKEGAAAAHGSIILAEAQTSGVGRRGRSWQSLPLGNLYFSLLWTPVPPGMPTPSSPAALLPQLTQLNIAASVAVAKAAESAAGVTTARIKWPNDVWAGSPIPKKLSGTILNFDGKDGAVLGVGINVLQDLSSNETATSLWALQRKELESDAFSAPHPAVTREAVLASFCAHLERLMDMPMEAVLAEYRSVDLLRGRTIRVHHKTREETDPRDFDAEVLGVDASGQLKVRPRLGGPERVLSGEEVSISPQFSLDGGEGKSAEGDCKAS